MTNDFFLYSSKLKKMSKAGSVGRKTHVKKTVKPSFTDLDGAFFSTTESFLNETDTFY